MHTITVKSAMVAAAVGSLPARLNAAARADWSAFCSELSDKTAAHHLVAELQGKDRGDITEPLTNRLSALHPDGWAVAEADGNTIVRGNAIGVPVYAPPADAPVPAPKPKRTRKAKTTAEEVQAGLDLEAQAAAECAARLDAEALAEIQATQAAEAAAQRVALREDAVPALLAAVSAAVKAIDGATLAPALVAAIDGGCSLYEVSTAILASVPAQGQRAPKAPRAVQAGGCRPETAAIIARAIASGAPQADGGVEVTSDLLKAAGACDSWIRDPAGFYATSFGRATRANGYAAAWRRVDGRLTFTFRPAV